MQVKKDIAGIKGYADATHKFIEATLALDFTTLHQDFIPFIPQRASHVLDIGAGIGRDASVLAAMGHSVVAVEPTNEFRIAGKDLYDSLAIDWVNDALPDLARVDGPFDFILASGVWHHLDEEEQSRSMARVAQLLMPNGIFAITLRHGPAGVGTHIFPTNGHRTVKAAKSCGLTTALFLENRPSLMPSKNKVSWTKVVFQKSHQ